MSRFGRVVSNKEQNTDLHLRVAWYALHGTTWAHVLMFMVQTAIDYSHLENASCYIENGIMIRKRRGASSVGECENDSPEKGIECCYIGIWAFS